MGAVAREYKLVQCWNCGGIAQVYHSAKSDAPSQRGSAQRLAKSTPKPGSAPAAVPAALLPQRPAASARCSLPPSCRKAEARYTLLGLLLASPSSL